MMWQLIVAFVVVFCAGFAYGNMAACDDRRCKIHKWTDSWPKSQK